MQRADHVEVIGGRDARHRQRRRPLVRLAREPSIDRGKHVAAEGQGAIARVIARDHGPRRLRRRGAPQERLAHGDEFLVRRLELLVRFLQALLLLGLRDVEPVLEQQHAFVGEHLLEARHLRDLVRELVVAGLAAHAAHDRLGVPGAEEHPDLALRRQRVPVAPGLGPLALVLRRLAEAARLHVARIHPLVEEIHRLAAARALHPGDQDQDSEAAVGEHARLRREELLAQLRLLAFVKAFFDLVGEVRRLEHRSIMV